jgi:hypothetical protein
VEAAYVLDTQKDYMDLDAPAGTTNIQLLNALNSGSCMKNLLSGIKLSFASGASDMGDDAAFNFDLFSDNASEPRNWMFAQVAPELPLDDETTIE